MAIEHVDNKERRQSIACNAENGSHFHQLSFFVTWQKWFCRASSDKFRDWLPVLGPIPRRLSMKFRIDPTKIVRRALQGAVSVAGVLVTTEAMVAEMPEKKSAPAMPHGGGMGGMDF
jgi:hypothetical protein